MGARKLHIAVLIKSFVSSGGSQRYAAEVARRLLARGHRIDLYTRELDGELAAGMTVVRIPERLMFSSVLALYTFARESKRLLTGKEYDVVHTHERGPIPADVATLHSFSYRGSGYLNYPFMEKMLRGYISPRSWLHLWLERRQMNLPFLAAVSEVIREDARNCYGRRQNLEVITPGVDTDYFHPGWVAGHRDRLRREEKILSREKVILFVGSEFRRKGLDLLIPAIGPGMRLIVVGRGERLSYYHRLAERHGIADRIIFTGLSPEVRRYYGLADVVVLPTRSEAFGMTVLEAMACGLPTVTSISAGAAALIEDGKNGFLLRQPDELSALLRRAVDPAGREKIGRYARQTAERYSWEAATDAYERLFYRIDHEKARAGV